MIKVNIFISIILFSIFYIIITWLANNLIITENIYFTSLDKVLTIKKIEALIIFNKKAEFVTYLFLPIIITLKYISISIIIFIGIKLFDININFKNCLKIVILADTIPLISSFSKALYFYIYPPKNFDVIQNFNPFGLATLFKNDSIPKYLLYPIQQLNLFEVAYWIFLAYGLQTYGNIEFKKGLKITSLSYGVGLLIWCVFIVFLQLQLS
jgi:hypothetical protein